MVDPEEMQDRHTSALAELAALGMALARDLSARAGAVATPEEAEGLALAFHRIARTVRLTLALESRLAREQGEVRRLQRNRVRELNETRRDQVRRVVGAEIWNESDGEDAEALLEALDETLDEEIALDRLMSGPVDLAIARIRADLGLAARAAGLTLPPPASAPSPAANDAAADAAGAPAGDWAGPDAEARAPPPPSG